MSRDSPQTDIFTVWGIPHVGQLLWLVRHMERGGQVPDQAVRV